MGQLPRQDDSDADRHDRRHHKNQHGRTVDQSGNPVEVLSGGVDARTFIFLKLRQAFPNHVLGKRFCANNEFCDCLGLIAPKVAIKNSP